MNRYLEKLQAYPFEKLKRLIEDHPHEAGLEPVSLAVGEPRHATPQRILDAYTETLAQLNRYPTTRGSQALRSAFADWLVQRFALPGESIHEDANVLPVNGTREALFACAQCMVDASRKPVVLIPNPFYQIYEGAALLAGAEPVYYDGEVVDGDIPALWTLEDSVWERVQLVYLCTPGNPSGQVAPQATLQKLVEFSRRYDFVIASDECYSEIYPPQSPPPMGCWPLANAQAMPACTTASLSTACQNGPMLRDALGLCRRRCPPDQKVSAVPHLPWLHPVAAGAGCKHRGLVGRGACNRKPRAVPGKIHGGARNPERCLPCELPEAGFTCGHNCRWTTRTSPRALFASKNVLTLPGSYLAAYSSRCQPGPAASENGAGCNETGMSACCGADSGFFARDQRVEEVKMSQDIIDQAFRAQRRNSPRTRWMPRPGRRFEDTLLRLDRGELRVAEKQGSDWVVHEWIKKAVLLSFRIHENRVIDAGFTKYFDKVAGKYSQMDEDGIRSQGAPYRATRDGPPRRIHCPGCGAHAQLRQHRRLCRFGDHGGHLGHGRLVRTDRQARAPVRRGRHRRGARAAAGCAHDHRGQLFHRCPLRGR